MSKKNQAARVAVAPTGAPAAPVAPVEAGDPPAAPVVPELTPPDLPDLVAEAQDPAAPAAAPMAVAVYPRNITFRNNGGFAVAEPATGAFIGAGASALATVHDEAQAVRVLQNVQTIEQRTGGRQRLQVIGLDDVVLPDNGGQP